MSGEELAFLKTFASSLSQVPVHLPDDYQPALEDVPKKVQIFPVDILPPPEPKLPSTSIASSSGIPITIKSTKPPLSFSLTVQPTDTISHIKTLLADQHPKAPDPSIQRLLLKGKVLSDTKLLKEYEFTPDTVFTLMTKPGSTWTGEERKQQSSPGDVMMSEPEQMVKGAPPLVAPIPQHTGRLSALSHTRSRSGAADELPIPSVVLSPTPTPSDNQLQGSPRSLTLEMDINANSEPHRPHSPNSYLGVVTSPEFWERLLKFLGSEFKTEEDSKEAWEAFFLASKGYMRAHEIAKVRDHVGVVGMGGR